MNNYHYERLPFRHIQQGILLKNSNLEMVANTELVPDSIKACE